MLLTLCITLVLPLAPLDTTVAFGIVKRDLTGDTIPEILTLTGRGHTIDSLQVTFTIESSGRLHYSRSWRLTKASFDPRGRISNAELRTRLRQYGSGFFAESKFMSPTGFLSWLQASARLHVPLIPEVIAPSDTARGRRTWDEMQAAGITVFQFSAGGDAINVIGWSARDQQFYNLLECC